MRKIILLALVSTTLAGCLGNDRERALAGGLMGAGIAAATDGDILVGTAIGVGAGALCDDVNVCR